MAKILFTNKTDKQKDIIIPSEPDMVKQDNDNVAVDKVKLSFVDKSLKQKDISKNISKDNFDVTKVKLSFVDNSSKNKPVIDNKKPVVFKKDKNLITEVVKPKEVVKPEVIKVEVKKPEVVKVEVVKPIIPKYKLTKCPFKEGDLIKYKDEIFLVKLQDGVFYIHTDAILSMRRLKPDDWGYYKKI